MEPEQTVQDEEEDGLLFGLIKKIAIFGTYAVEFSLIALFILILGVTLYVVVGGVLLSL